MALSFQYQDWILYVRSRTGAPRYEISAGGEAQTVKIKSSEGFSLDYFLPSDRNWFVVSTEQRKLSDAKSAIYEVYPASGKLRRRYHSTGPITFILLSTCVCSKAVFSSAMETCRLIKNTARIRNSVPNVAGNQTPSSCRW